MAQARDGVLEDYVENQPELSFGSEAEIRAAVIVGEMFGSMNDFRSTGLADFRVQDVLRGTSPDTVRVRMFGEPWFTHALARIRVGAAYLMAIKEIAPGKYRCVNGKLGIFRVSDAGYLGTSGTAVEI